MPIEAALMVAVTALAGAVVYLWKQQSQNHEELKVAYAGANARIDECEEDRRDLREKVGELREKVACLGSHNSTGVIICQAPNCPIGEECPIAGRDSSPSHVHIVPSTTKEQSANS